MRRYIPEEIEFLPKQQQKRNVFFHTLVLGFNSGQYDLILIKKKKPFVTQIPQDSDVKLAKKQNKVMYVSVATFLEICSYISPGTGQEKWMKTYGAKLSKLWFSDEWFETAEKLDFPGLLPHEEWFSELKNEMTLSEEAYRASQRIWQEKGMRTFKDLLRFHNNLDFEPFLEALGSIRDSYTGLGIDIFKDAVPLPGVSMKYLLRRTLNKRDAPELYAPGEKAYEILKGAVVRGAEPGVLSKTTMRTHKFKDAKMCPRVLAYDANALYPSTMEVVAQWAQTPRSDEKFIKVLQRDRWFGFAYVDIEVPRELWTKFEEMPPLF